MERKTRPPIALLFLLLIAPLIILNIATYQNYTQLQTAHEKSVSNYERRITALANVTDMYIQREANAKTVSSELSLDNVRLSRENEELYIQNELLISTNVNLNNTISQLNSQLNKEKLVLLKPLLDSIRPNGGASCTHTSCSIFAQQRVDIYLSNGNRLYSGYILGALNAGQPNLYMGKWFDYTVINVEATTYETSQSAPVPDTGTVIVITIKE
jgi:hypothetical protein